MTQLDTPSGSMAQLVAPDVYRVRAGFSNAYLVVLRDGGYVIVDAGRKGYGEKVVRAGRELFGDRPPEAILLTHGHLDHAGGVTRILREWPELAVFAHALELPYLNEGVRYPPGDATVGGAMAEMSRLIDSSLPTHLPVRVQALPEEIGELDLMPGWFLLPTPGHTPGHVSLWQDEERILLAGDAVATMNPNNPLAMLSGRPAISVPPPFATYNWHHARQSARAVAELDPMYLCAGHGTPVCGAHVAGELRRFAEAFPMPRRGRYVHTPARFNRDGPTFIPDAPVDYVKYGVLSALGVMVGLSLFALVRNRRSRLGVRRA